MFMRWRLKVSKWRENGRGFLGGGVAHQSRLGFVRQEMHDICSACLCTLRNMSRDTEPPYAMQMPLCFTSLMLHGQAIVTVWARDDFLTMQMPLCFASLMLR
jgi:hypothetical protein